MKKYIKEVISLISYNWALHKVLAYIIMGYEGRSAKFAHALLSLNRKAITCKKVTECTKTLNEIGLQSIIWHSGDLGKKSTHTVLSDFLKSYGKNYENVVVIISNNQITCVGFDI